MPRELVLDTPLMVKLDPTLKRRLKAAAAQRQTDMSKLTREAIARYLDELDRQPTRRGELPEWIQRMTGTATSGLTTDEIMQLTRGE
jgi:predicted transcriptional regulator